MLKIDLHVHTHYSDARSTVLEVVKAAKNRGLDGIAITDHHTLQGVHEALALTEELIVIPGIEVETQQGHILGLGIQDDTPFITRRQSVFHVAQMIRDVKGIIVIPHPCTPFFSMERDIIEQLRPDAIEVLNAHSPCFGRDKRQSTKLAKQLGVAQVAGSDSHTYQTVGDAYTVIDAAPRVNAILQAIREGKTRVEGVSSPWKYKLRLLHWLFS